MASGHPRKRGSRWTPVLNLGKDADGKRITKSLPSHRTKKAAEQAIREALAAIDAGTYVEPTKLTVREFLERWLRDQVEPHRRATTHRLYSRLCTDYLIPHLGSIPLSKLSPLHVVEALNKIRKEGRVKVGGPLSPASFRLIHATLDSAMRQAVKWRLLASNPVDGAETAPVPKSRRPCLSLVEAVAVAEAARDTRIYVPIWLAFTLTMRRGEILGLRWEDVDLETGVLQITQQRDELGNFTRPKSDAGLRPLTLPSIVVEVLREHHEAQTRQRETMGSAYHHHGLVIQTNIGTPWDANSLSAAWRNWYRRLREQPAFAGLPSLHFHDLRHTSGTAHLRVGVDHRTLSERMGHADIAFTLRTYTHGLPETHREAARLMDDAIREAMRRR